MNFIAHISANEQLRYAATPSDLVTSISIVKQRRMQVSTGWPVDIVGGPIPAPRQISWMHQLSLHNCQWTPIKLHPTSKQFRNRFQILKNLQGHLSVVEAFSFLLQPWSQNVEKPQASQYFLWNSFLLHSISKHIGFSFQISPYCILTPPPPPHFPSSSYKSVRALSSYNYSSIPQN